MFRRLLYDPAFDAGSWTGQGRTRATIAESCVGNAGLLGFLEEHLGLPPGRRTVAERAVAIVPRLLAQHGFWSESAEADPYEVARDLLRRREELLLAGWDGSAGTGRLAELASVTTGADDGIAGRLRSAAAELAQPDARLPGGEVVLLEPRTSLPKLLRQVLSGMEAKGFVVREERPGPAGANGDLAAAREASWKPAADGSLQLLRSPGPIAASEEAAAWLASQPWQGRSVVVGGNWLFDQALRRFGLPTTGGSAPVRENVLLQMLPLVLAAGEKPPDPARVVELLALPGGPVPRRLARRLIEALREWPAVGSPDWGTALAGGLASLDDEKAKVRLEERIGALFSPIPTDATGGYDVQTVQERLRLLARWTMGHLRPDDDGEGQDAGDPPPAYLALASQLGLLQQLLALCASKSLPPTHLRRLVDLATEEAPPAIRTPGEAGIGCVRDPGAIAGPADFIIWLPFSRATAPAPARPPWSPAERTELARLGVEVPDPGDLAEQDARRWRRPLEQATGTLLLVCPEVDEQGEEQFPHPIWDELAAAAGGSPAGLIVRSPLGNRIPRVSLSPAPAPTARRTWKAPPGRLGPREKESASGLEAVLGCPFRWTLMHHAGIRPGALPSVGSEDDSRVLGSLAHFVIERALGGAPGTADEMAARARDVFDKEAPRLVAGLFRPGRDRVRERFRIVIGHAAAELARLVDAAGLRIDGFEQTREVPLGGGTIQGRIDVLLGPTPAIIDMKYRGGKYYTGKLGSGTAVQLATYSHVATSGGSSPPVGYFIIESQRLLTNSKAVFAQAEEIPGATMAEVWSAVEAAYRRRLEELAGGSVVAPAIEDASGLESPVREDALEDGKLQLTAPCRFCDFGALCGVTFAAARAGETADD